MNERSHVLSYSPPSVLCRAVQAEVSRILFAELQPVYVLSGQTAASRNVASLSQNWALQLLLDIKVLSELLQVCSFSTALHFWMGLFR